MGKLIDVDKFLKRVKKDREHEIYLHSWTADMVLERLDSWYAPPVEAIVIPDNATNGDMIKALWNLSDDDIDIGFSTVYVYTNIRVFNGQNRERLFFNKDWWNASYKKGAPDDSSSSD